MTYHNSSIPNLATLKNYGNMMYKITSFSCYTQHRVSASAKTPKGEAGNEDKLQNSLSRSKNRVFELAFCNPWELFVTFTLDPTKYDRHDLNKFQKDLSQFIRDYRKKYHVPVEYLLIPEQHQDGCWHMHGFLMNLPISHLRQFTLADHLPIKILDRIKAGKQVFSWDAYSKKFGFSDIEVIENNEASAKYITKYVTKDALRTITELNAHIFYASQNLQEAVLIGKDILNKEIPLFDYENEYCRVKWFDDFESADSIFRECTE